MGWRRSMKASMSRLAGAGMFKKRSPMPMVFDPVATDHMTSARSDKTWMAA